MNEKYLTAVSTIKEAILRSQNRAARNTNLEMLSLYYSIGGYISDNSRKGTWGTGAIEEISNRLREELPGLRGFSPSNIKLMRQFYEEWKLYLESGFESHGNWKSLVATSELKDNEEKTITAEEINITHSQISMYDFTSISFTHHIKIIQAVKTIEEREFYVHECALNHWSITLLNSRLKEDFYHHHGALQNNFSNTIADTNQYRKAMRMFKDEFFLDFINTEELDITDPEDLDERVLEKEIVDNIRSFIQCLGSGFCFIGNQHRIEVGGEEYYADLLFYQRDLKALVVIELKKGKFKPQYLGQLNFYLSALDEKERREGENPSIGILLCREANRSIVELAIRDYTKPLGVATYRNADDLPEDYATLSPILEEGPEILDKAVTGAKTEVL